MMCAASYGLRVSEIFVVVLAHIEQKTEAMLLQPVEGEHTRFTLLAAQDGGKGRNSTPYPLDAPTTAPCRTSCRSREHNL
jgi:hypothetical protein